MMNKTVGFINRQIARENVEGHEIWAKWRS